MCGERRAWTERTCVAMLIRFWGTRGSLPAPIGNRAVRTKIHEALLAARGLKSRRSRSHRSLHRHLALFDRAAPMAAIPVASKSSPAAMITCFATWVRACASSVTPFLRSTGQPKRTRFNVFMSHLHWDHIMGFPFFTPAYIPGNVIRIHGCHKNMREAFQRQQSNPSFPVDFKTLGRDHRVRRTRAWPHLRN